MPYKDKEKREEYIIKWRELNRNHLKEYDKKYYHKHKDDVGFKVKKRATSREHYKKHKKRILKRNKEHYQKIEDNPKFKLKRKRYYKEYSQRPEVIECKKKYRESPKRKRKEKEYQKERNKSKKYKEYQKRYQKKYTKTQKRVTYSREYNKKRYVDKKEEINKKHNQYVRKRKKIDKNFKIMHRLRNLVYTSLKHYTKTGKIMTSREYGIDYKAIIEHLQPFPKNLSDYEIHHTKPLFTFNFINKDGSTNLEEVKKAFAPENHQLLTIKKHKEIHKKL